MRRVVLLAFIWGWSFMFIKVALEGMTPSTIAFTRIALGMAVMLVVLRLRRASLPRDPVMWRHFAVMGLTSSAIPFTLLAWGEEHITSALTSVVNASTPLFAAVMAAVALGERLRKVQLGGLMLGFVGVAVAAGVGGRDLAGSSLTGVGAAVLASSFYGFGFAYARRHLTGIPPLTATCGQLVTGTVLALPAALATTMQKGFSLSPTRAVAVVLLGVLGTGFAYLLNYAAIADLGATRASLVTYLVPIVAVSVGVLFLSEPFHVRLLIGGALTVMGIALLQDRLRGLRRLPLVGALLTVLAVLGLGACVDDSGGSVSTATTTGKCGAPLTEALDPGSLQHVLPGGPEPSYTTDPPTSGPHRPVGNTIVGVQTTPLDKPTQVGVLEGGGVLLQYHGLSAEEQRRLERQAGGDVRVAPNPALSAPVVATAWRHKVVCQGLDVEALKAFVRAYAGGRTNNHAGQ
ncbi:MAG TPA: EamA family transporter [Acidimicrobiales bacterium]|jgi:drug/metabolite transporter (DMT)-like permease|nr:EamA family transporter [Acidimicrobiales bacterium]